MDRGIGLIMLLALLAVVNLVWTDLESVTGSIGAVYLVIPLASIVMLATVVLGAWGIVVQLRQGRGTLHFDSDSYPARRGGTFRARYERGPRRAQMNGVVATLYGVEIDIGPWPRRPAAFDVYSQTREFSGDQDVEGKGRRCWLLEIVGSDARETSVAEPETFLVPVY